MRGIIVVTDEYNIVMFDGEIIYDWDEFIKRVKRKLRDNGYVTIVVLGDNKPYSETRIMALSRKIVSVTTIEMNDDSTKVRRTLSIKLYIDDIKYYIDFLVYTYMNKNTNILEDVEQRLIEHINHNYEIHTVKLDGILLQFLNALILLQDFDYNNIIIFNVYDIDNINYGPIQLVLSRNAHVPDEVKEFIYNSIKNIVPDDVELLGKAKELLEYTDTIGDIIDFLISTGDE